MSPAGRILPRIAITGFGAVTPYARTAAASWRLLLAGRSAVRWLSAEELGRGPEMLPPQGVPWGGPWAGAPAAPPELPTASGAATVVDPVVGLALECGAEALEQSRILGAAPPERIGCVFGTSKGGLRVCGEWLRRARSSGEPHSAAPLGEFWESVPPSIPAATLSRRFHLRGPCLAPVTACATGLVAILRGARLVREGVCDAVLVGSSDASLTWPVVASFRRLGVWADRSRPPAEACRPFDRDRSGFVVGEGAGCLVLERWDHAVARGVPLWAEWIDGLERGDPTGITLLPEDPACLVRLLADLLPRTGSTPADIDAVCLHGTGTVMNDRYEARGLRTVMGERSDSQRGFSVKGGIGHLLGAAGSVETVFSVLALHEQVLPPTINCEQPAEDCPFPVTGAAAVRQPVRTLLKLSLGFGGHLAAGILRRVEERRATREHPRTP